MPQIKNVADRFAAAGYAAFAPDLYNSRAATEPNTAQKLMQELNIEQAAADMAVAAAFLRTLCKRVGCVGFCLGGGLTLQLAALGVIDAAVPYYGVLRSVPDWQGVRCPILGHYAAQDSATDALPELQATLAAAGKPAQFHIYPGTGHGFLTTNARRFTTPQPRCSHGSAHCSFSGKIWGSTACAGSPLTASCRASS